MYGSILKTMGHRDMTIPCHQKTPQYLHFVQSLYYAYIIVGGI